MPDNPYDALYEPDDPNRAALRNPRVKQFLDKIGQSEGADYNTLVGGSRINDLSHHPNKVGLRTSAGPSTAFGKYQIVGSTERSKLRRYAHLDYSPENQDLRAVELLRQTGALKALENNDEPAAVKLAGREWASLPGSSLPGRKNTRVFKQSRNSYDALHTQQSTQSAPANPYDALYDQPSGQTLPPRTPEQRTILTKPVATVTPSRRRPSILQPASPAEQQAIEAGVADYEHGQVAAGVDDYERRHAIKPVGGRRGELLGQLGQQRTVDEAQRQQEAQARADVVAERSRLGMSPFGYPTGESMLRFISSPIQTVTDIFTPEEEKVNREVAERLRQQQIASTPEVTGIRKEYGSMPAAVRSVVAPLARGGAGILRTGGGIASAFGIAPNQFSDWANKRAEIIEAGAANTPLKENRGLSSLITGQPTDEKVQRGVPERIATGLADLGIGIGQIVLLQKATGLSLPKLLALEGAAKASDKPVAEQLAAAGEGYALGTALTSHLGRGASAALFGAPTAAQTGYEVSQGRMSPLDAAIQTGVQTGAGFALGGSRQRGTQTEVKPDVQAQREAVERQPTSAPVPNVRSMDATDPSTVGVSRIPDLVSERPVNGPERSDTDAGTVRPNEELNLQRFYHRDFGEVVKLDNQSGARRGKTKVAEADNPDVIHYVKTAQLTGAGNQRLVPIREVERVPVESTFSSKQKNESTPAEIEQYLEPPASSTVYHSGTTPLAEIDIQRVAIGSKGRGIYFSPTPEGTLAYEAAKGRPEAYSNLQSATLDLKRPLDVTKPESVSRFVDELETLLTTPPQLSQAAELSARWGRASTTDALARNVRSVVEAAREQPNAEYVRDIIRDNPNLTALAKTLGYDGIVDSNESVVFDRSRIRPAGSQGQPAVEPTPSPATESQLSLQQKGESTTRVQPPGEVASGPLSDTRGPIANEPITKERVTTAPKNAAMDADRVELGLPELERVKGASAEQVLADAKQRNASDPRRPDVLAEQALRGGKNFTDTETMQVNLRAAEIKNRVAELQREIADAKDNAVIADKGAELDTLVNEFDRLSQAQRKSGTEWGRAGIARQRAIDEDYSLVSMVARFRKDARRVETPAERVEIERLHARNAELESKLADAESRRADRRLQDEINRTARRRRRTQTKQSLDDEFVQLKTRFAQARAESRGVQPSGLAGLDPEGKLTKIIAKMARNRVEAGITDATQLVDDVYAAVIEHLPDVSKRDVRDAISGYSIAPKTTRGEIQRHMDALRSELKSLSKTEDVAAGTRSPRQEGPQREFHRDQARQRAISKEIADLERRMSTADFSDKPQREPPRYTRETARLQRQLEQNRAKYARMRYKATRSTGGKITDELAKAANVPKTLKSIGDVSAMFRQGGYYAITHPIAGLAKPTRAMLHSITDTGWRNVEAMIKADPAFEKLKQAGVEFTGVDKADPNLSHREEGYLGGEYLDYVPVAKQVKDFSERTFVSFLDAQRLHVGKTILDGMTETQRNNPAEVKAVARLINIATGRGELGKRGNQLAPALNIAMFSPRLLASRVQLLNNMINPVTIARMPPGARRAMIADNVKFLAATGALLGLAKAAGATVSTDPDDAEFLKIRVGNTVYDTLTGLQQPLRYVVNMARAASPVNSRPLQSGPDMYSGRNMAEMSKQFARSKLNPALAPTIDFVSGQDFEGRKFSAGREARDLAIPLPAKDVYEGLKEGGIIGGLQATPTFVGVGVGSYPPAADKPHTHAEKLARKLLREGMPPSEAREEEQIETDREKAQLRARSRAGENINAELVKLIHEGKITDRQAKRVAQAKGRTRLSEDLKTLDPEEAMRVYSVMNADERRVSAASIKQKIANSKADAQKKAKFKQRARELGLVQ